MTVRINADRAIELLREAVTERGNDFVYSPPGRTTVCKYVHVDGEDVAGCGVGLALHKGGVSLDVLKTLDGIGASSGISAWGVNNKLRDGDVELTEDAASVLRSFQTRQDMRESWGVALRAAEITYQRYLAVTLTAQYA